MRMVLSIVLLFSAVTHAAGEEIRHSFFIAGPTFTGIIAEDNSEVWNSGRPGARDGYVLPSGTC
jgi:hypothetical protein